MYDLSKGIIISIITYRCNLFDIEPHNDWTIRTLFCFITGVDVISRNTVTRDILRRRRYAGVLALIQHMDYYLAGVESY